MIEKHETVYMEPNVDQALSAAVVSDLDGVHLRARSGEAIRLATVDADSWPHEAELSVGEVLALSPTELLVAIWPRSHTAQNLHRDGRLTLALVYNGALLEIRARATVEAEHQTKQDLTVFRIKIEKVSEHRAALDAIKVLFASLNSGGTVYRPEAGNDRGAVAAASDIVVTKRAQPEQTALF
jgi:hypothetical protein